MQDFRRPCREEGRRERESQNSEWAPQTHLCTQKGQHSGDQRDVEGHPQESGFTSSTSRSRWRGG